MVTIKGLVKVAHLIRQQLQVGVRPEEIPQFQNQVASIIKEVEAICARNRTAPEQLPTPSRQAYWYLKEMDTSNLPVQRIEGSRQPAVSFGIKNLVKAGDALAELLGQQSAQYTGPASTRQKLRSDLQGQVDSIERLCSRQNATPAALEAPSRRVYYWFKFLLSENNLQHHLEVLVQARTVAEVYQPALNRPLRFHLMNLAPLWRKRLYSNAVLLRVNEGFLYADHEVWQALVRSVVSGRDAASDRLVREFAESDDFNEVLFELESFVGPDPRTAQGHVHNLDESFTRVNEAYLGGRMPKPALVWNQTLTVRKFGHYQPSRDTVTLSISLDQPGVPAALVDYVMYHELLHKKHGVTVVNGRRTIHGPSFREEERRFAGYEAAERQLWDLARRQRRPAS